MNFHHVPSQADRLYVPERGEIVYDGPPAAVAGHPDVLRVIGGAVPP